MAGDVDADLLRAFVDGDRDAFEALYRRFHRQVHAWILRIGRDPSPADDAVVEAFWRAYRSRARFDATRSFGAWMRRIATNASLDQLRDMARRPAQYDGEEIGSPPKPDDDVGREITLALRRLSPKLRVIATLALIEERPLAEIADAIDIPVGTVKSRLFRATRALRAELLTRG